MARKSKDNKKKEQPKVYIENSGVVVYESITETLEKNYMPYAISVIISRALPEIDGFKPSHRKLLYTMYKMGLLTGPKTKSANVVGQTMKLNPHGDGAIYETMVRMTRGNETLLHAYIDSKGNFGKFYSRDMSYAASRYTEVKLDAICNEIFKGIDKNTVEFMPNYDNTMKEPKLLPVAFPSILVNSNMGIAVSMASSICPFNLDEVCETCIELIKNSNHDIISTLKGPDFPGGGFVVYDEDEMKKIYDTGRGSVRLRSKYNYDKKANCIEVTQIPYSTTVEAIMDKIVELIKQGKIREISYIRDETDLGGLKLTIDLKRGTDPDRLMQKLFKMTPLQDNFSCNFNILIDNVPRVMGVAEILSEWVEFRKRCVKRRVQFDLEKARDKLHLLIGLQKIILDIDKAIKIVRETEEENDVISNLMIGFGIDSIQAEYVAEIKLRNLNKEYIINRLKEIENLEEEIRNMEDILSNDRKIEKIIISELNDIRKKYGKARKTMILFAGDIEDEEVFDDTPDYPVNLFLSLSGYFKKIIPQSLRMSSEQKLKEEDYIIEHIEATNKTELIFFTDMFQAYKTRASDFEDTKASVMGDYIPAKLEFDEDENVVGMIPTTDYSGYVLFCFENGKVAKVPLNSYETKTNRRRLMGAYSDRSALVKILFIDEEKEVMLFSSNGRAIVINTEMISAKVTRNTIGVQVMTLRAKSVLQDAIVVTNDISKQINKYRVKSIPAAGSFTKDLPDINQLKLI